MPIKGLDNNCLASGLNALEIADMNLTCSTCSPNSILQNIISRKVCARFNLIKDCIKYNRGSKFADSTLLCTECLPNNYLNSSGQCQ